MDIETGVLTWVLAALVVLAVFFIGYLFGYAVAQTKIIELHTEILELKQKLNRK